MDKETKRLPDRETTVLLDYVPVILKEGGSWNNPEDLLLAPREDKPEDRFGFEKLARLGYSLADVILDLYRSGELQKAGDVHLLVSSAQDPDVKLLDFVVKAKDIPDWAWGRMKEIIPVDPCTYSYCTPVIHLLMSTYRDNCGCVGKSWEHFLVEGMDNKTAHEVNEAFRTGDTQLEGAFAAGRKIWDIIYEWNNVKQEETDAE